MQISISIAVRGLSVGISNTQKLVNSFETRVLADGGTFEAGDCLNTTLIGLGGISDEWLIIFDFRQRVLTDGGVFEAESCLNTTLTNLNNI